MLLLMSQRAVTLKAESLTITPSQETITSWFGTKWMSHGFKGHWTPNICKFMGGEAVGNENCKQEHCYTGMDLSETHLKNLSSLVPVHIELDSADCYH